MAEGDIENNVNVGNVTYESLVKTFSDMASYVADVATETVDNTVDGVIQMVDTVLEKDDAPESDGVANTTEQPDNFIDINQAAAMDKLIDQGAFTVSEMEERGIDPNDMFKIMANLGYDDTVPVYYTQEPGQDGLFSMSEIYGVNVEVSQIENQEDLEQKIQEITTNEVFENLMNSLDNGEKAGLKLKGIEADESFSREQKDQLIDAVIERNRGLIDISKMDHHETLDEMDRVIAEMDRISGGQYSKYQSVVGNWGNVDRNDPNQVYWSDVHRNLSETITEYRDLSDRLDALRGAHRKRGEVQEFVRDVREVRPDVLEQNDDFVPEDSLWNNDAFNMK